MPSVYDAIYFLALFLCVGIRLLICFKRCYQRRTQRLRGEDIAIAISSNQDSRRQIRNPEERKELILASIIIKKAVLPESSDSREFQPKNDEEEGIVAYHAKSKPSIPCSVVNIENFNENNVKNEQKGNIIVDTFRSITSSVSESIRMLNGNDGDSDPPSPPVDNYSAKTCPICLDAYTAGQDICWSQNDKCVHSFHLDCMQPWLMKSSDCPLCRENYLNNGSGTS